MGKPKKEGFKASTMPNFKGQKYSSLKKDCIKKGELFQDSHFPANNKSLFYSKVDKGIEWKRPGELCKVPKLVVDGVTNDDLNEGELGNSWFVSACTALAKEPKLFNKVIPDMKGQEWSEKNEYAGIFRFQFWRYGRWLEVVIDDLLPTRNGHLIFVHSHSRNEFWSALLEKAYAKLYGDYESLEQGFTADALVDFTGGVPEKLVLRELKLENKDNKAQLFQTLLDANENKALINCVIAGKAPRPKMSKAPAEMPTMEAKPTSAGVAPPPAAIYDDSHTTQRRNQRRLAPLPPAKKQEVKPESDESESEESDEESDEETPKVINSKRPPSEAKRGNSQKTEESDVESDSDSDNETARDAGDGLQEKGQSIKMTNDVSWEDANTNNNNNKDGANQGLIQGHGYILSDVRSIKLAKGLQNKLGGVGYIQLVRLRNPWGVKEWTGAWSDESPEWNAVSLKDRKKMGITFQQEGEFWMGFDDFCKYFTNVDICHFVNTSFFSLKKTWTESMLHDAWTTGAKGTNKDRAGGNDQTDTYLDNPQYLVDINAEKDVMMLSLEQDDEAAVRGIDQQLKVIGVLIFKTEENRRFRMQIPGEKVSVSEYKQSRSIFHKVTLTHGRYIIIPTTKAAMETCAFLMRVYTGSTTSKVLQKDYPTSAMCSAPYVIVTRLNIKKAVGIQKKEGTKSMDAYAVVKCEGESVQCQPIPNTDAPEWELKVIFYRKKPSEKPITIEIYNSNTISDDLVGIATIEEQGKEKPEVVELELYGKGKEAKGKEKESLKPGKLFVEIKTSDDLTAF